MSVRSGYSPVVVEFCLNIEAMGAAFAERADYLDWYGEADEAADAADRAEYWSWWYSESCRVFPGATLCEHGLSLQLCYGPSHYVSERELRAGW